MQDVNAAGLEPSEFEDPVPPYRAAEEEAAAIQRAAEQELERRASVGRAADDKLGSNGKPLVVGDIAHVSFGTGTKPMEKSGTLLSIGGGIARVRFNGSKDAIGDAFPFARVRTESINGGKPLKTKGEKKDAAQHASHLAEYREALADVDERRPRPSDGFAHAYEWTDEVVPMPSPRRVLPGHNLGVSESTLYRHAGRLRSLQDAVAEANGRLRQGIKAAKDDGVDTKLLKQVMSELRLSEDEVVSATNELMSYRAAFSLPNAGPISAREAPDPNDQAARQAYARDEGLQAGFRGAARDTNPFSDPSDPCCLAWDAGYVEAQRKLLSDGIKEL